MDAPSTCITMPPPRKVIKHDLFAADLAAPSIDRLADMPRWKKPPQRHVTNKRMFQHYAFANVSDFSPKAPPVRRQKFQPELIDRTKFLVCKVRPYPEWPLICIKENLPAFETEKDAKKWHDKSMSSPYKMFTCRFCGKVHAVCPPNDITGQSSGKNLRKQQFLRKYNAEHEGDDE